MKVIVAFANMRVIVPCKDEDLTVAGLINSAISRYKKASQKVSFGICNCRYLTYDMTSRNKKVAKSIDRVVDDENVYRRRS